MIGFLIEVNNECFLFCIVLFFWAAPKYLSIRIYLVA